MKRLFLALVMAVISVGAFAQFEQGTMYANTSLTGLNLSYSKNEKFSLGLDATGGYFIADDFMLFGRVGYSYKSDLHDWTVGAGARYYIRQNGLYLGLGAKIDQSILEQENHHSRHTSTFLTPEVGYCFYLNHYVSVEPAVYYDMSLNHFSSGSKVGLKLGFGFYF